MQLNKWKRDDERFDVYIQNLKEKGVQIHPNLVPAIFTLNNGLEYPGLKFTSSIKDCQDLVQVPIQLLLTAHKATQENQLNQVYKEPFYYKKQDRILVTYLLFVYVQKKSSIWGQMVNNFSPEIDILSFWPDQQLERFKDTSIKNAAHLERANFENEWTAFEEIQKKHTILQQSQYTKQNYKWIYIHTVSRCFGSFMNSTYFTPYCEFFNHHCVDVSFHCATKQELAKEKELGQEKNKNIGQNSGQYSKESQKCSQNPVFDKYSEIDDQDFSSVSSSNSCDYIEDGDFNYWEVPSCIIKWGGKICFNLQHKQTKIIEAQVGQIQSLLDTQIVWSGFNFLFVGQVLEKIRIVENEYKAGRKKYNQALEEFKRIHELIDNYAKEATGYYKKMGSKYIQAEGKAGRVDNSQASKHSKDRQKSSSASNYQKSTKPPDQNLVLFRMQSHERAQFNSNDQAFFCYGQLSNRTMLIRYGCCIEQNKYDHVWLRLSMAKAIAPYPDLLNKLQEKQLPIYYKVKVRPHVFPFELYLWFKMTNWKLTHHDLADIFYATRLQWELHTFTSMLPILQQKLSQISAYKDCQNLQDPQIGYHEYFTRVYHLEKVRILKKQIEISEYVLNELSLMQSTRKVSILDVKYQRYLKGYWNTLKELKL